MRSDGWLVLLSADGGEAWNGCRAITSPPTRKYVAEELGVDGVSLSCMERGGGNEVLLLVSFDPRLVDRTTPAERVEALAAEAAGMLVHEPGYPPLQGPWQVQAAGWRAHDKWGNGARYAAVSRA